jgi:hypothetical protein
MEPYSGDVLEYALNKGVLSAATHYQIGIDQVSQLVVDFAIQIGDEPRCACELSRVAGMHIMCFACTGPLRRRILV